MAGVRLFHPTARSGVFTFEHRNRPYRLPLVCFTCKKAHILSAARVPAIASCPVLGTKTVGTVAAGVFDAADTTFTALTGDQVESLILFKDTGTESTSKLVAFWDTATGLPLTPNGGDVTVQWNASGILQF